MLENAFWRKNETWFFLTLAEACGGIGGCVQGLAMTQEFWALIGIVLIICLVPNYDENKILENFNNHQKSLKNHEKALKFRQKSWKIEKIITRSASEQPTWARPSSGLGTWAAAAKNILKEKIFVRRKFSILASKLIKNKEQYVANVILKVKLRNF